MRRKNETVLFNSLIKARIVSIKYFRSVYVSFEQCNIMLLFKDESLKRLKSSTYIINAMLNVQKAPDGQDIFFTVK